MRTMFALVWLGCGLPGCSPGDPPLESPPAVVEPLGDPGGVESPPLPVVEEPFCPTLPGEWSQCAWQVAGPGRTMSYQPEHVRLSDFTAPDGAPFVLEAPFSPAIAVFPDGRRVLVGFEPFRSAGVDCRLLGQNSTQPQDCPMSAFAEVRESVLVGHPLLGELDAVPGIDAFFLEGDFEEFGGPSSYFRAMTIAMESGGSLPTLPVRGWFFSFQDGRWIDFSRERGFSEQTVFQETVPVGMGFVDLDSDGVPEFVPRFMARDGSSGVPVWTLVGDEFVERRDMLPPTMNLSFYALVRGPTDPQGVADFLSVGRASEVDGDAALGSSLWRGSSMATAAELSLPRGVFGGSPMGAAFIDLRGRGASDVVVSDVGPAKMCEAADASPRSLEGCWERHDAVPMEWTDWGDEPISWSVVATDFNGDGAQDLVTAGSWHKSDEDWAQQLGLFLGDGRGALQRYVDPTELAVRPFALPAHERALLITSAGDAPPDVIAFSINREGVEGESTERYLGNPSTVPMERLELRGPLGTYACGAYVEVFVVGATAPTLIGAPCTGGNGFYPPHVWVPAATTERVTVLWTDGSTKTVNRTGTATDRGFLSQIIQAD